MLTKRKYGVTAKLTQNHLTQMIDFLGVESWRLHADHCPEVIHILSPYHPLNRTVELGVSMDLNYPHMVYF